MNDTLTLQPSYYEALKRLTLELVGVNLGSDHTFLIETRLSVLARKEGFTDLSDMVDELFSKGQTRLAIQAVSALLERDTHFFSDMKGYEHLETIVLPELYRKYKGDEIRIMSFGCSSGQEAYGVAMLTDKVRGKFPDMEIKILGVDYPSSALGRARLGKYSHFDVQRGLPVRDLITYFEPDGEDWCIKPELRDRVNFLDFHLLSNLEGLGEHHVVLFRNNLPHYSSPALIRVFRGLANIVKPSGYLILGSEENFGQVNYGFDPIVAAPGIFRRRMTKALDPLPADFILNDGETQEPSESENFEPVQRTKPAFVQEGKLSF